MNNIATPDIETSAITKEDTGFDKDSILTMFEDPQTFRFKIIAEALEKVLSMSGQERDNTLQELFNQGQALVKKGMQGEMLLLKKQLRDTYSIDSVVDEMP